MSGIRVVAVSTELAEKVRSTGSSPGYGHATQVKVATGHGPCRHCLRVFEVGVDRRILFTLNHFYGIAKIPAPGPVFVHEADCQRYDENAGYPEGLLGYGAVLDGYDAEQMVRRREIVTDGSQESVLQDMFGDNAVRYVLVRDLEAGCFDFRVERRESVDGRAVVARDFDGG